MPTECDGGGVLNTLFADDEGGFLASAGQLLLEVWLQENACDVVGQCWSCV